MKDSSVKDFVGDKECVTHFDWTVDCRPIESWSNQRLTHLWKLGNDNEKFLVELIVIVD